MKLALITNYVPDQRPLSQYGYHLAHGLRQCGPQHSLLVLSGRFPVCSEDGELRVWRYGRATIPFEVLNALRALRPDGIILNTHFTAWGSNLANLASMFVPLFARLARCRAISLVHHLPQTIDSSCVGYRLTPLHRLGIEVACRAIAHSDVVCFTTQENLRYFTEHYSPKRSLLVSLGLQGVPSWSPPPAGRVNLLAFGYWGRAKDPTPLLDSVVRNGLSAHVTIAGGSSHTRPGFIERLRAEYASDRVTFTGYVPETEVAHLFHSASLVVLPYRENTGASAVAHQACQFGRAILARRLPVFEEMQHALGLCMHFYDSPEELHERLGHLLSRPEQLAEEGLHNYRQVQHLTMDKVARVYWDLLEHL